MIMNQNLETMRIQFTRIGNYTIFKWFNLYVLKSTIVRHLKALLIADTDIHIFTYVFEKQTEGIKKVLCCIKKYIFKGKTCVKRLICKLCF